MSNNKPLSIRPALTLAALAVALRVALSSLGENYDMDSWWIVSEVVTRGDSVYASTHRYNYGPIWMGILGMSRWISSHTGADTIHRFHMILAVFLSMADLAIAWVLGRRHGLMPYAFFLLNPVNLLITGYHSQMDGISIAFALVFWQGFASGRPASRCGGLLGLSLMAKQILAPFLVWLVVARRPLARYAPRAALVASIGTGLFVAGFAPWFFDGPSVAGIRDNVLRYSSTEGPSLILTLRSAVTSLLGVDPFFSLSMRTVFLGLVTITGLLLSAMRVPWQRSLYLFLLALFALSSGTQDQYLAVPMATVALSLNTAWSWAYTGVATVALLLSGHNIGSLLGLPVFATTEYPLFLGAQLAALGLFVRLVRTTVAGDGEE